MIARFDWMDAKTVDDALGQLGTGKNVMLKAGGVDVMDRLKEGLESPERLVNIHNIPGLNRIEQDAKGGVRIGALVTLAQLDTDALIRKQLPALADAAGHAATPNLRNMATVGGNLCQRPRCWYFRNHDTFCKKKGGDHCFAQDGENDYHAIFDNQECAIVHPSDTATALAALDATVELQSAKGPRKVPLDLFFSHEDIYAENTMQPNEMLTYIHIPPQPAGSVNAYIKMAELESHDWPIASVAVRVTVQGGKVNDSRIILGAAAATPWRAKSSEAAIHGKALTEENARAAGKASMDGATPMTMNAYKMPIFEAIVRRTLMKAVSS